MTAPRERDGLAESRTLLFVPGDRPERFAKATASGADGIILDLEDAVTPVNKAVARGHVAAWLSHRNTAAVRVNAVTTPWFAADLEAVREYSCAIILPKASVEAVASVTTELGDRARIVALVETAAGVVDAVSICRAPNVIRAAFGSIDLSTEVGVDPDDREALLFARSALVLGSTAAGIAPPLDGVTTDLATAVPARADAEYAARLGFTGKLCIHPKQIEAVNAAFSVSPERIAWAHEVLEAATAGDDAGGGAIRLDGQMIDAPVVERARRLLARHDTPSMAAAEDTRS